MKTNKSTQLNNFFKKLVIRIENLKKFILQNFSVILEDTRRVKVFFEKNFPLSYKYLPFIKITALFLIFLTINSDSKNFQYIFLTVYSDNVTTSVNYANYTFYSVGFYLTVVVYEYFLSLYVIFYAYSPVRNLFFQTLKQTAKAAVSTVPVLVGFAYAPVEPNTVSNIVHTKTPFGRGYDFEIGVCDLKAKGGFVAGALGNSDMINAITKHSPDTFIVDQSTLEKIYTDPEFKGKIRAHTTIPEKLAIGMPLVELPTKPEFTSLDTEKTSGEKTSFSDSVFRDNSK
jgi:hypothetical protein